MVFSSQVFPRRSLRRCFGRPIRELLPPIRTQPQTGVRLLYSFSFSRSPAINLGQTSSQTCDHGESPASPQEYSASLMACSGESMPLLTITRSYRWVNKASALGVYPPPRRTKTPLKELWVSSTIRRRTKSTRKSSVPPVRRKTGRREKHCRAAPLVLCPLS